MRKLALFTSVIAAAALSFPIVASATPTATKPPVKLEGKVNDKGTKTAKDNEIEVEQDDFYFEPTFIKAKKGTTLKVELENEGNTAHTFTIDSLNVDKEVQPGKKATVKVKVPSTGSVAFYCRFHQGQGMQGAIFSKAGAAIATAKSTSNGGSSTTTKTTTSSSSGGSGY